jgi:hypothetical protein
LDYLFDSLSVIAALPHGVIATSGRAQLPERAPGTP